MHTLSCCLTGLSSQVTPDSTSSNVSAINRQQLQQSRSDSVKALKGSLKALTSSRDWTVVHRTSSSFLDPHAHPTR